MISGAGSHDHPAGHDPGKILRGRYRARRPLSGHQPPRPARVTGQAIMDAMPAAIDQATRAAVTARITAHVQRGWPRLGMPLVHFHGQFCYVSAVLPGHREPTPILRLRYQGSTDRWSIGIYLASHERYTESELPASFGPTTGTPEEGVDHTFILYAGPGTQH